MKECNWDPKKHDNKPCPVHSGGGEDFDGDYESVFEDEEENEKGDEENPYDNLPEKEKEKIMNDAKYFFEKNGDKILSEVEEKLGRKLTEEEIKGYRYLLNVASGMYAGIKNYK